MNTVEDTEAEACDYITKIAWNAKESLLPCKSKHLYEETYSVFKRWCLRKKVIKTTEDVILAYFNTELACYKSSSLRTKYSMLRSTINLKEGVDISKFPSVIPFLKRKGEGYKPKKSLSLSKEHVDSSLIRANDEEHLLNKVVLVFGVAGACRRQELVSLTSCVEDYQTHFLINLVDTKSKKDRSFIIVSGDLENVNLLEIIRRYMALRPAKTTHTRVFLNYVKQKCTVEPVGVNKIASVPSIVAKFLNLENASAYTGHCLRRTSATILANANAGVNMEGIKRHGGWRSSTVAEGYIDESKSNKISVAYKILGNVSGTPLNTPIVLTPKTEEESAINFKGQESIGMYIANNASCTININHYYNNEQNN